MKQYYILFSFALAMVAAALIGNIASSLSAHAAVHTAPSANDTGPDINPIWDCSTSDMDVTEPTFTPSFCKDGDDLTTLKQQAWQYINDYAKKFNLQCLQDYASEQSFTMRWTLVHPSYRYIVRAYCWRNTSLNAEDKQQGDATSSNGSQNPGVRQVSDNSGGNLSNGSDTIMLAPELYS